MYMIGVRNTKNRFFGANCHNQSNGLCCVLTTEGKRDDESSNRKRHFRGSGILVGALLQVLSNKNFVAPIPSSYDEPLSIYQLSVAKSAATRICRSHT